MASWQAYVETWPSRPKSELHRPQLQSSLEIGWNLGWILIKTYSIPWPRPLSFPLSSIGLQLENVPWYMVCMLTPSQSASGASTHGTMLVGKDGDGEVPGKLTNTALLKKTILLMLGHYLLHGDEINTNEVCLIHLFLLFSLHFQRTASISHVLVRI